MPPKSRYALRLPQMLDRFGSLASCFVHERRHKELKRFANNQCNSAEGTERHLMEEMLLSHLEELKTSEPVIHPALVGPKPASKEVQQHFKAMGGVDSCNDLLASSKAYYAPNRWAATGDVVLMRRPPGVGEVVYRCKFEEYLLTCVSPYSKHSSKDNCFTINRSEHTLIFSSDIANTCIFDDLPSRWIRPYFLQSPLLTKLCFVRELHVFTVVHVVLVSRSFLTCCLISCLRVSVLNSRFFF